MLVMVILIDGRGIEMIMRGLMVILFCLCNFMSERGWRIIPIVLRGFQSSGCERGIFYGCRCVGKHVILRVMRQRKGCGQGMIEF